MINKIEINNLSVGYNKIPLLNNISFNVEKNTCCCIYGENGCGKTTLLKTLSAMIPPVGGSAIICGNDLKNKWKIRKLCATVFQNNNIDFGFPILAKEAVALGRYRINPYKENKEDFEIIKNSMIATNVWDLRDIPYGHLSGGQRQRVNISLALASEPEILFLDEPGTYLDTKSRDLLIEIINKLKKNITVVMVSHYKYLTQSVGDKVICLEDYK